MIRLYFTTPFNQGTLIGQPTLFTGTVNSETNPLSVPIVNDSLANVGSYIQWDSPTPGAYGLLYQYQNGFIRNSTSNSVVLNQGVAHDALGIIPTSNALVLSSYDQSAPSGLPSGANIDEQPFYLGDVDDIHLYNYLPLPGPSGGIALSIKNAIPILDGFTVKTTLVQLACCDQLGNPLTYAAPGAAIVTPLLNQFGLLSASSNSLTMTCFCTAATTFIPGDFVFVNKGQGTQEILRFQSAVGTTMTFSTSFNYPHYVGEPLFACARQFYAKQTIPINSTFGETMDYVNLYLQVDATQQMRLLT